MIDLPRQMPLHWYNLHIFQLMSVIEWIGFKVPVFHNIFDIYYPMDLLLLFIKSFLFSFEGTEESFEDSRTPIPHNNIIKKQQKSLSFK